MYDQSLKNYRDWYAIEKTAFMKGEIKGEIKGEKKKGIEIALNLIKFSDMNNAQIAQITVISEIEIENLRNSI